MITIIGLGAGDISQISFEAMKKLKSSEKIFLRTEKHPIVEDLDISYQSFDSYYDDKESFEEVYDAIAKELINLGKNQDIVYAVPGHPRVAERSVSLIEAYAEEKNIELEIISSMSFVDAMYSALRFDPSEGFRLLDAFSLNIRQLDADSHVIITQVCDRFLASNLKLQLMEYYLDDQEIKIVKSAGIRGMEDIKTVPLYDLDRAENEFDDLTSIFISKSGNKLHRDIYDLEDASSMIYEGKEDIDFDQEYRVLAKRIEDSSRSISANVEKGDIDEMIKSIGEVFLSVIKYSQLGVKEGYFDLAEITETAYDLINNE